MITVPDTYNYIEAYLTYDCLMGCPYCINKWNKLERPGTMPGPLWIEGLRKIETSETLPITIGGGEPTMHPNFYSIVNRLHQLGKHMDLLTNCSFDVGQFCDSLPSTAFRKSAPYAGIRISYHANSNPRRIIDKIAVLRRKGFSVGVWALKFPPNKYKNVIMEEYCREEGIDYRVKEYLGIYKGELFGTYKYPAGLDKTNIKNVLCKGSEILINPSGNVYRCHHDLYEQVNSLGNISDESLHLPTDYLPCNSFGKCNPCDLKTKFDRYQVMGHCAVDIKELP